MQNQQVVSGKNGVGNFASSMVFGVVVLSVVSLVLSAASFSKAGESVVGEKEFATKIEKGIDDFIAKKQAEQVGSNAPSAPQAPAAKVDVSAGGGAMMGSEEAPVTIIEFSDFQCPFCERLYSQTLPQIKSQYIDAGKVKFIYRHFPLSFHENARPAAIAAECVRQVSDDAVFFEYHDLIFTNQALLNKDNLKVWAQQVGVDMAKWGDCFDNSKTASKVDRDEQDGRVAGVSGTPAVFINGRLVSGAQPFSVFQGVIEEELRR